jgi:Bacterial Ig domain
VRLFFARKTQLNSYAFTGPPSLTVGVASTDFTVTPPGTYSGTITITPSGGGLTTPIVLTWSGSGSAQTFTVTPTTTGTVTLTPTNSGGLANPPSLSVPVNPSFLETFDSDTVGSLPSSWAGYSHGGGGWVVATTNPHVGANGLAFTRGTSPYNGWAGIPGEVSTNNHRVYVDVLVENAQTGVIARGANLGTSTATGYVLDTADGVGTVLRISSLVSGTATLLASITTSVGLPYLGSGSRWFRLELDVVGTHLQGFLWDYTQSLWITTDNGLTYRTPLLDIYDSSITSGTSVGVATLSTGNNSACYVDQFGCYDITGTDARPSVSITSPSPAATLTGTSTVTLSASGGSGSSIVRVVHVLDGTDANVRFASPFSMTLDSKRLTDGSHTISARVYDSNGNWQSASPISVTSSNGSSIVPTSPTIPAKRAWIKEAIGIDSDTSTTSQNWFVSDCDWAMVLSSFAPTVAGWDSTIPLLLYTNITNLYFTGIGGSGFVCDWNRYADANGVSRELPFIHLASQKSATGTAGGSTRKCRFFWAIHTVFSGTPSSDLWSSGTGTFGSAQQLGPAPNDYLALGYVEPIRLFTVNVTIPASGGWIGVIEYPSAIDGSYVPTTWSPITPTSDGTNGFTTTGTNAIQFVPPLATWKGAKADGFPPYLYYLRIRTTHTGTPPTFSQVFSEDFLGTASTNTATMPTFDFQADANGDGYLSDAEFANARTGMTARFAYWSRYLTQYGDSRWNVVLGESPVREWFVAYEDANLASIPSASGYFLDNASGNFSPTSIYLPMVEPYKWMINDNASMCGRMWIEVAEANGGAKGFTMANVLGQTTAETEAIMARAPGAWEEHYIQPITDTAATAASARSLILTLTAAAPSMLFKVGSNDANACLEDVGTVAAGTISASTFPGSSGLDGANSYATAYMVFTSGSLAGSQNQITTYTPSTRVFTFSTPWSQAPSSGDAFWISGEDATGKLNGTSSLPSATALYWSQPRYQDRRLILATLAYYYSIAAPQTYIQPFDDTTSKPIQPLIIRAAQYNVGVVTETTGGTPAVAGDNIGPKVWATGTDPADGTSTYTVWIRHYANAIILYRPLSKSGISTANNSAVSFDLTGLDASGFKQVQFDGTLGSSVITSISLRNFEGAILVPQ